MLCMHSLKRDFEQVSVHKLNPILTAEKYIRRNKTLLSQ